MARLRDIGLTVAILALLALVVARLDESGREAHSGPARVADGDTLTLAGQRIRLAGIDAPELAQSCRRDGTAWPCGTEARAHLSRLIGKGQVDCAIGGSDRYGRLLAVCTADGRGLNGAMVADGYAVAFGDYEREEALAREARLGLWAGSFEPPQSWRRTHGGMAEAPHIPGGWMPKEWVDRLGVIWSGIWNG